MRRLLLSALVLGLAALPSAQNRMTYSVVSPESGHVALGLAHPQAERLRHVHADAGASRRRDTTRCSRCSRTAWACARSTCRTTAATAARTRSGRSCSATSACCARRSCSSAHRIDGAEQYFTRAIDYGYSFDPEEVIDKWGRDADRRRLRPPDPHASVPTCLLTMNIQGRGGDRAHEATTILAREAYKRGRRSDEVSRADRARGCGRGSRSKLYFTGGRGVIGGRGGRRVDAADAAAARAGAGGSGGHSPRRPRRRTSRASTPARTTSCSAAPTPRSAPTRAAITSARAPAGCRRSPACSSAAAAAAAAAASPVSVDGLARFPGRWTRTRRRSSTASTSALAGLAQYAGAESARGADRRPRRDRRAGGQRAQKAFDAGDDAGTAAPIEAGLDGRPRAARAARLDGPVRRARSTRSTSARTEGAQLRGRGDRGARPHLRGDRRRRAGDRRAAGEAVARDDESRRRRTSTRDRRRGRGLRRPGGVHAGRGAEGRVLHLHRRRCRCRRTRSRPTPYFHDNYWKHPENLALNDFEPGVPFGIAVRAVAVPRDVPRQGGQRSRSRRDMPIQFRYVKDIYLGDKRMELNVVPAFSVKVSPGLAVIPVGEDGRPRRRPSTARST